MGEVFTLVSSYYTSDHQIKYRITEYEVLERFIFDIFSTAGFLSWIHGIEDAMKNNPEWDYRFEAGGGHDNYSLYLAVHRFKDIAKDVWEAHELESEVKSRDARRQEYLRLKKEFENES